MKKEWGNLNRVRLGPNAEFEGRSMKEVREWCEENLHEPYFHSDGYECFYFRSIKDAIFFKLRWY